jgi:uncharacterized protein (TIGR02118 family)
MHKMLVLYPKGQDEKKFRPYYEREHASLVAKLPGLKASRYSFAIGGTPGAEAPYYCIFEAEFADEAAMGAALRSPQGQAVVADIPNYVTIPPTIVHYDVAG